MTESNRVPPARISRRIVVAGGRGLPVGSVAAGSMTSIGVDGDNTVGAPGSIQLFVSCPEGAPWQYTFTVSR